jgi:osmotically-inducible protein OsmY
MSTLKRFGRAWVMIAAFAGLLCLSMGCGTLSGDAAASTDEDIVAAVRERLSTDPVTSRLNLGVQSKGGVVMLSGSVRDSSSRARAVGVAQGTPGVKQVVDGIQNF